MEVIIDIIDTKNNDLTLKMERALKSSIVLDWRGSDRKDDLIMVGSSLDFSMVGMSCEDGQYYDLFTGDETRFKVRMYTPEDVTLWTGFLMPDFYSEPYRDNPIPVNFTATDGLGRLKGKFLSDDFYEEEKSVIEIISACLKLTGLDLSFRFSPALENSQQKDYNLIYLPGSYNTEKEKNKDAYEILETLLSSMFCVVFQADNFWNIEGINIREQRVYSSKLYDSEGFFIEEIEITRLLKEITALATPQITIQPPYGVVSINHERIPVEFPETITDEKNDGWVEEDTGDRGVYATDWMGHNGYFIYSSTSSGLSLDRAENDGTLKYVSLRRRIYLEKGKKYRLTLNFKLIEFLSSNDEIRQDLIDQGLWTDPFLFFINLIYDRDYYNETESYTMFTNFGQGDAYRKIQFNLDMESDNDFFFVPEGSGLLDIRLFPFITTVYNNILVIEVDKVELEELGFSDTYTSSRILDEDYTQKKEIEIAYADDSSAFSKSFRLKKLDVPGQFEIIEVPILRSFQFLGANYLVVDLKGANLIDENIDAVEHNGQVVDGLEVIYNYQGSQEHVVKSPIAFSGSFSVKYYDFNSVTENRDYWQQWTDAYSIIERKRYTDAALDLFRNMFDSPIPSIQSFSIKNNIKINDFIKFNYRGNKDFMLTSCKWIVDQGFSTVTAIQAKYGEDQGGLYVEAGQDVYISDEDFVQLSSVSSAEPPNYIVSKKWTEVTNTGAMIVSPSFSNTSIGMFSNGLPQNKIDYAVFQIEVTDNTGRTSRDTVAIYRVGVRDFSFEVLEVIDTSDKKFKKIKMIINPDISAGAALNIKGQLQLYSKVTNADLVLQYLQAKVTQNGVIVNNLEYVGPLNQDRTQSFSINYIRGDQIEVELLIEDIILENVQSNFTVNYFVKITIDSIQFVQGIGNISGFPTSEEVNYP